MTVRVSTAARNAMVSAVTALVNAGSGPGYVRIYTGAQPASPATAASGTLLAEIVLNDPAYGAPSTGVAAGDVDPAVEVEAVASGTAGWWRLLDSDNVAVVDGAVTSGEMTVSPNPVSEGAMVTVSSFSLTSPAA